MSFVQAVFLIVAISGIIRTTDKLRRGEKVTEPWVVAVAIVLAVASILNDWRWTP